MACNKLLHLTIARSLSVAVIFAGLPAAAQAASETWVLDNLKALGKRSVTVEGAPRVICAEGHRAIAFDGAHDSLFVKGRPLVGASRFTIEALIRPDGGAVEQRFLHVAETDPVTGQDVRAFGAEHDVNHRIMFELRMGPGNFFIDGFLNSKAGAVALAVPEKVHPTGEWHVLTQTYDGTTYRTYVDGILQGEVATGFEPQGPGNVRIGSRMNHVSYFKGAISRIRFSDRALRPDQFMSAATGIKASCAGHQ